MTKDSSNDERHDHRPLWLAVIGIVAAFVGAGAGLLNWSAGEKPAAAVLAGGSAAGVTLALLLGVYAFVAATGGSQSR
jgi:hypothetical protein